jgi:6-phosphogluconate dehydrogenase
LGPIFERISAHVDGEPCCMHVGPGAAGHFVKMVHNGIEYADMQLIAEAYDLMREIAGASPEQLADIFGEWNKGDLESFLIELTMQVLSHRDAETGKPFVDIVEDQAEQKGTGRWTVQSALDLGVPVTGIAEATFARSLSGHAEQRSAARDTFGGETNTQQVDADEFIEDVRKALYASKIVAYAQGFDQMRTASDENEWAVNLGRVATIWRGGCIIRARFLNRIREAYDEQGELPTLLAAPYFADAVKENVDAWRRVVATAAAAGVPAPAFASSLAYFDALRREHLPASLIQGLRDNFGAHTYRRTDKEGSFHTLWAEEGQREISADG